MNESEFWAKIDNNEAVYFENQFAEMVYRILPNQDAEGKGKGEEPYFIQTGNSNLADAISEKNLITKEQFDNF